MGGRAEAALTRTYRLDLMGSPVLTAVDAARAPPIALARASMDLLVLFAVHTRRSAMSREAMSDLLWPNVAPDQAKSRLSSALWRLRKAFDGAPILLEQAGTVALASDLFTCDLWDLDDRCATLRAAPDCWEQAQIHLLDTAMQRRRGNFLEGVQGDWVDAARQIAEDQYAYGLECLVHFYRQKGERTRSIDAARDILRMDPYREDIHAALIDLYAEAGQTAQAIGQFERCDSILKTDLGVAPCEAVRASAERAMRGTGRQAEDMARILADIDQSMARLNEQVTTLRAMIAAGAGG